MRTRRQSLQNQLLLMKSASDSSAATAQTQKALEEQLQEVTAALQSTAAAAPAVERPAAPAPQFEEYVPEGAPEPSPGLYDVQPDEAGGYQVSFTPYAEEAEGDGSAREASGCTVNTDRVDAEIKALKEKRDGLEQQLARARRGGGDPQDAERLQRQLAAMEAELSAKDTDAYRKQHSDVQTQ